MISALTLDISQKRTGWAVGTPDGASKGKAGWGVFEPEFMADREHITMRRFAILLDELHARHKFTHICMEKIITVLTGQTNPEAKRSQFNMEGVVMAFCGFHNIDLSEVPVGTWRAQTYGFAKAPPHYRPNDKTEDGFWKKTAIQYANLRGWNTTYHDEAEALGVMNWLFCKLDANYEVIARPFSDRLYSNVMNKRGIFDEL